MQFRECHFVLSIHPIGHFRRNADIGFQPSVGILHLGSVHGFNGSVTTGIWIGVRGGRCEYRSKKQGCKHGEFSSVASAHEIGQFEHFGREVLVAVFGDEYVGFVVHGKTSVDGADGPGECV